MHIREKCHQVFGYGTQPSASNGIWCEVEAVFTIGIRGQWQLTAIGDRQRNQSHWRAMTVKTGIGEGQCNGGNWVMASVGGWVDGGGVDELAEVAAESPRQI